MYELKLKVLCGETRLEPIAEETFESLFAQLEPQDVLVALLATEKGVFALWLYSATEFRRCLAMPGNILGFYSLPVSSALCALKPGS